MSYRSLKRLLGESGLERKTRYLLGAGVIVLMSISFTIYARQTEELAYNQLDTTGKALVPIVVARAHVQPDARSQLDEFVRRAEYSVRAEFSRYKFRLVQTPAAKPEHEPQPIDVDMLLAFQADRLKESDATTLPAEKAYLYYGAVRAVPGCVECHTELARARSAAGTPWPEPKTGDLLAVVAVQMPTDTIEDGFHKNRAWLIAFAVGTTLLILAGTFLIVRYVIVKPVRHLKEVSDAIADGQLNVRSEIQTGDEFEDLSIAFNRMLRNLISMQDRNRGLITDLDRKVDELAQTNLALYESNRLKGDFLHTMSHELRTPLNSVIGFSEVLLAAENLTDKQHRWAANIMTSGQQLLTMINDILDLAKMEAGKMRLHPEPLHPADLCEHTAALFRPQAERKRIDLRVHCPPNLPAVRQDAGKLRQILHNLVSNAVKFTPEGGRVGVAAEVADGQAVFRVTDTGVGIAPEEQELVFQKFRQSANPLTREQGGSGLGLSIVRELAKLLGGDIAVVSELGRGSTFTVRVAAELKDEMPAAFEEPREGEPTPPAADGTGSPAASGDRVP